MIILKILSLKIITLLWTLLPKITENCEWILKHGIISPQDVTSCFFCDIMFFFVWFDALRPSQQLWSCRNIQFTLQYFFPMEA